MNYHRTLDGNLAALDAHLRADDAMNRLADATEKAWNELEDDTAKFADAIYDISDSLGYWNLDDAELHRRAPKGGWYFDRLAEKRQIAKAAMKALQTIYSTMRPLTVEEQAIKALIKAEVVGWVEKRVDELEEAANDEIAGIADFKRDQDEERKFADYLSGHGEDE